MRIVLVVLRGRWRWLPAATLLASQAGWLAWAGAPPTPATAAKLPPVKTGGLVVAEARVMPVRYAALSLQTGGVVSQVLAAEGDRVEAGQVILRLDSPGAGAAGWRRPRPRWPSAEARLRQLKRGPTAEDLAAARQSLAAAEAAHDRLLTPGPGRADHPEERVRQGQGAAGPGPVRLQQDRRRHQPGRRRHHPAPEPADGLAGLPAGPGRLQPEGAARRTPRCSSRWPPSSRPRAPWPASSRPRRTWPPPRPPRTPPAPPGTWRPSAWARPGWPRPSPAPWPPWTPAPARSWAPAPRWPAWPTSAPSRWRPPT